VKAVGSGLYWRLALWAALVMGWLVMLLHLWSAFATFPTAERLEQARMVRIPTLRSIALLAGRSALEITALLALLWPWRPGRYTLRLCVAGALLAGWFLATTPLTLSAAGWVHRRWLAATAAGLVLACIATALVGLASRLRRPRVG
jgi:hypothetical protein